MPSPRNVASAGSRSASPETATAIQDLNATTRQLVGWSDFEISGASNGNPDETIDMALSKVIGEDELGSFRTGIDSALEAKYAEAESSGPNWSERWSMLSRKSLTSLAKPSNRNKQFSLTT